MKTSLHPPLAAVVALAAATLLAGCSMLQKPVAATAGSTYLCESGQAIVAAYPTTDTAAVRYQGREYDMLIAISASGARYVGGGLEWWTKGSDPGSEGLLLRHLANGTSGEIVEICTAS